MWTSRAILEGSNIAITGIEEFTPTIDTGG